MPPENSEQARWFTAEVLPHEADLRSWLARRFPDADIVDDVVQESYLRILKTWGSMPLRSPRAFLFRTARNLSLDYLKSHGVSRKIAFVEEAVSDVVDGESSAPEALSRREELEIVKAAIESLPKSCRRIVTLREAHGLSQREIAEKLGVTSSTVCDQLAIGLRKCRAYVRNHYRKDLG